MEISTKFGIGDTVSAIDKNKIIDFAVNAIVVTESGVLYRDKGYSTFSEEYCFANREEVYDYILTNTVKNDQEAEL